MARPVTEAVIAGTVAVLARVLPVLARGAGPVSDAAVHAAWRRKLATLQADLRAAARSSTLPDDLGLVVGGFRACHADQRAVIRQLGAVVTACRAHTYATGRAASTVERRLTEILLVTMIECYGLAGQARAVAGLILRSHEEAQRMRRTLSASFDVGIERAADAGLEAMLPLLRETQSALVRDLTERGRPLPRFVSYETGVPLPAVVLAHRLYQDAGRADELVAENEAAHPAFMPIAGRALSQ